MYAIILAGGFGTRLKRVIDDVPKPMAPVAGKPFLEYIIRGLVKQGIKRIILSTGYKTGIIEEYFKNGKWLGADISYSVELEPLGTGGAIKKALDAVDEERVFVMNGDSYFKIDVAAFEKFYLEKKTLAALALVQVNDCSRFGTVITSNDSRIIGYSEKNNAGSGFINAGAYILNRTFADFYDQPKFSIERDVFPKLIDKGIYGFKCQSFFIDMGIPETYNYLCQKPDLLNL
ncbi:MAG TPA: nucleotidyltransferase family protein [bacterium]|nr:nucleotidyltransferase family protein [bacterium]HPN31687.1 nucleotidyltransferase family protein [bacterium]